MTDTPSSEQPKGAESRLEKIEGVPTVDAVVVLGAEIEEKDKGFYPDQETKMRALAGREFIRRGHAQKIILTGFSHHFEGTSNIARAMKNYLSGVAEYANIDDIDNRILVETESSRNTFENIIYALKAIAQHNATAPEEEKINSALFISNEYHLKRVQYTVKGIVKEIRENLPEMAEKFSEEELEQLTELFDYIAEMQIAPVSAETVLHNRSHRYDEMIKKQNKLPCSIFYYMFTKKQGLAGIVTALVKRKLWAFVRTYLARNRTVERLMLEAARRIRRGTGE